MLSIRRTERFYIKKRQTLVFKLTMLSVNENKSNFSNLYEIIDDSNKTGPSKQNSSIRFCTKSKIDFFNDTFFFIYFV